MNEKTWAWQFPGGKMYRVVSNPEEGTINVYNPKGEMIQENKDLTPEGVQMVEQNFLRITAVQMNPEEKHVESDEEKVWRYIG